jgi:hypothetical protein
MTIYRVEFDWTGKWALMQYEPEDLRLDANALHKLVFPDFNTPEGALEHFIKDTHEMIQPCKERLIDLYDRALWAQQELEKIR